ncbi:MAG: DUF72 domain-containing protein [Ignavibacteria bacterium]|nr:DUF72 domain-containing protein [Ignavibacteria bacterium]
MAKFYVGTSGWSFHNWVGKLYPNGLPQNKWLNYYSQFLNCVEVNSTFYRLFKESTYKNWVKSVPDEFLFIVKVPKEITHIKKLINVKKEIEEFLYNIMPLKSKLGIVLLQLPPSFDSSLKVFEETLDFLREKVEVAVEFRNNFAYANEVINLLIEHKCCYVNPDSPRFKLPHFATNDVLYYRLHGRLSLHKSAYSDNELSEIVDFIKSIENRIRIAFIIFNNGVYGHSITNAFKVMDYLGISRKTNPDGGTNRKMELF